jgi:hypothetical protein
MQGTAITITTIVGGIMLLASIIFLIVGVYRTKRAAQTEGGGVNAGVFIIIGFALLAMGSLTFLFGAFRPGP